MRVFVYISRNSSQKFAKRRVTLVTNKNACFSIISSQNFAKCHNFCLHLKSKIRKTSRDKCHKQKCGFLFTLQQEIQPANIPAIFISFASSFQNSCQKSCCSLKLPSQFFSTFCEF